MSIRVEIDDKPKQTSVNMRLSNGIIKKIDKDIRTDGVNQSRSDWVNTAIHFYLAYRTMCNRSLLEDDSEEDNEDPERGGGGLINYNVFIVICTE